MWSCFKFITVILSFCQIITSDETVTKPSLPETSRVCVSYNSSNSISVKHKACFLRPDTGPCRADIIQWYFDAKMSKCYRFFWGGCQGNGNKFETKEDCLNYCYLKPDTPVISEIPNFCSLTWDYGTCFGYFNRWAWDIFTRTCKRRIYSGCGGNQNNFETYNACINTCLIAPDNDKKGSSNQNRTTCIPIS